MRDFRTQGVRVRAVTIPGGFIHFSSGRSQNARTGWLFVRRERGCSADENLSLAASLVRGQCSDGGRGSCSCSCHGHCAHSYSSFLWSRDSGSTQDLPKPGIGNHIYAPSLARPHGPSFLFPVSTPYYIHPFAGFPLISPSEHGDGHERPSSFICRTRKRLESHEKPRGMTGYPPGSSHRFDTASSSWDLPPPRDESLVEALTNDRWAGEWSGRCQRWPGLAPLRVGRTDRQGPRLANGDQKFWLHWTGHPRASSDPGGAGPSMELACSSASPSVYKDGLVGCSVLSFEGSSQPRWSCHIKKNHPLVLNFKTAIPYFNKVSTGRTRASVKLSCPLSHVLLRPVLLRLLVLHQTRRPLLQDQRGGQIRPQLRRGSSWVLCGRLRTLSAVLSISSMLRRNGSLTEVCLLVCSSSGRTRALESTH